MNWRKAGLVLLGVLGIASLAFSAGVLLMTSPTPPSLAGPTPSLTTPVSPQGFVDPQPVTIQVTEAPAASLYAKASGTITSSSCKPGAELISGESTFSTNGVRLINLATDVPPWRPLQIGDHGSDVSSLQQELGRWGADLAADGVFGKNTLKAAIEKIPGMKGADHFDPGSLLWTPAREARIVRCLVDRGQDVAIGDALAEVQSDVPAVIASGLPADALAGPRELVLDDLVLPLAEDGALSDPARGADVVASAAYRDAKTDEQVTHLSATARLSEPFEVASVPPSAVLRNDSGDTCVLDGTHTLAVRVVGSELGQTFVLFEKDAPDKIVTAPDPDHSSCR